MIYRVMLFKNVTSAMKSEKLLNSASIPIKLIPVPKTISPDCGVCLRFDASVEQSVIEILSNMVDYVEIRDL